MLKKRRLAALLLSACLACPPSLAATHIDAPLDTTPGQSKAQPQELRPAPAALAWALPSLTASESEQQSRSGRFSKDALGVITDSHTGLQWYPAPGGGYNWDKALSWVQSLSAAGGRWRMPTRSELAGLRTETQGECSFDSIFPKNSNGFCGDVWSGEIREHSMATDFDNVVQNGREDWEGDRGPSGAGRAFAVRSRLRSF